MTAKHTSILVVLAALFTVPASAQSIDFAVGPQITTLGVGVGVSARVSGKLGIAADYNLFPISKTEKNGFNNELLIEPALQGGNIMVTLHPGGGKFAIGAGILTGGMNADVSMTLDPNSNATIKLGDGEYPASGVGTLAGTFEYGSSVQPSFLLGWLGKGLNFAIGAAIATPTLELSASGPLRNDASFQADLQREIDDFDDEAGQVPVYPYLRLGWQFSF